MPKSIWKFCLFFLIFGLYTLTFYGMPVVRDEEQIFDATESLIHRNSTSMNYDFYTVGVSGGWKITIDQICGAEGGDPWEAGKYEFLIYYLMAPITALAFFSTRIWYFFIDRFL